MAAASYQASRRIENWYGARLRNLARHVGEIVRGMVDAPPHVLRDALFTYSQTSLPWAQSVAARMVADVDRQSARVWFARAEEMGRLLRQDATLHEARRRQDAQVDLITSLPREAAARVQHLAHEALIKGTRADALAKEILRTGEVTKSRATLIAQTEVGKTTTLLTQVRAESVGSTGYIWRTSRDGAVRPSHRAMEGKFVAWDAPPTLDGLTGHAGCLPRCRCWPEVVLPD